MRLIECKSNDKVSLRDFPPDEVPRYAILSHTWSKSGDDEVTFKDMTDAAKKKSGLKEKPGLDKIKFCRNQAERDGLKYFWVDTCCIDKSNSVELYEAINSMFRWYRDAARCYVYLADVSTSMPSANDQSGRPAWKSAFRKSKWFTRGWTLQELIAPASVEFFSKEGEYLGNKRSLERHICDITGVPARVLRGKALSGFSVAERMAWVETRETTRAEDKAYSLLGIFDVHMPLIYGEGRENAFRRLREEVKHASKGIYCDDFSVNFSLSDAPELEHFVAREEELTEIEKALSSDGSRRVAVLHGLGGIGKTQLAIAYAKRHKDNYSAMFWVNIKDKNSLKQSFARLARQILREHPSTSQLNSVDLEGEHNQVIDAVRAWLSLRNNTRWLLIFDNYDNPAALDIREFLPDSYQGSVIITTRSSQIGISGHRIRIGRLTELGDSLEILSKRSGRQKLIDDPDVVKLATELDGFPLALATAGAYLEQVAMSYGDYLSLYKESWAELQKTSPQLSSYEERTLYSTWQLSYDHIKQENRLSAELLRLWAYFDNQDIWFELLRHRSREKPGWARELTKDELSFTSAIRVLCDYGLVEAHATVKEQIESSGYSMHACVHAWTTHVLNQEWDYNLAKLAVRCVASHIWSHNSCRYSPTWWPNLQRTFRHVERCLSILFNSNAVDDGMERYFYCLGNVCNCLHRYDKAEELYLRLFRGHEKTLGPDHEYTLCAANKLGEIYSAQGRLDEAEPLCQRALRGFEKTLGSEHSHTLRTIHTLSVVKLHQRRFNEAEKLLQQVSRGFEKALGPDHVSTLGAMGNLANVYLKQKRLDEAERLRRQVIEGYEKSLGLQDVLRYVPALDATRELGCLLGRQGKFSEARSMFARASSGYEAVLGTDSKIYQEIEGYIAADIASFNRHGAAVDDEPSNDISGNKVSVARPKFVRKLLPW
ncbi:hypothetical protein F4779DRAFT_602714 [Xylariaceae sp. FL0662B]|nr:hypothetical protein F4779DRAFT_602714 [Xylariaceae sp. FL0662B]